MPAAWAQDPEEESEDFESPARQNPILREYFRKQYLNITPEREERFTPPIFLERYVDRQIDHFLKGVEERLADIRSLLGEVEQVREEFVAAEGAVDNRAAQQRFRNSIRQLESQADDLRKHLAFMFPGLDDRTSFRPSLERNSLKSGFQKEIVYIREQLDRAEDEIRDYLFHSTNTVRLEALKEEGMLILLYRAKEMAKRVREEL